MKRSAISFQLSAKDMPDRREVAERNRGPFQGRAGKNAGAVLSAKGGEG
jgi:hypothetical protein